MTPRCLCLLWRRYRVTTIELTQRWTLYARTVIINSLPLGRISLRRIKVVLVLALRGARSGAVTDSRRPATRHSAWAAASLPASPRALFCHWCKNH